jgi:SSS family transporter
MNLVLGCILLYIVAQLAFVFWFSRRVRTESDYLLAGRSLGPWLGTFSVFATWYGAETCIGAAGEAYASGVSGVLADPFGYTLGIVAFGLFFAAGLWKRGLVTMADLFRDRWGGGVEKLASLIMIPSSVMWAAAQIRAFGQVLASASEVGLLVAITMAAAVVVLYTAIGGMWADAVTDLVQGLVLIAGIVALFVIFIMIGGGESLAAQPIERLNPVNDRSTLDVLDTLAIPIFSTIAAQELVSRVLAMRGAKLAARATVGAGVLYLVLGLLPMAIGLGAAAFIGDDQDPEQMLALFAQQQLPMPLYILFLGALVSAILSTLSGALLVAGSLLAHNIITPLLPGVTEKRKLRADRAAVVFFGVVAYVIALASDSIYDLVQESSAIGTAGILVLLVFGMWAPKFGGRASAYAALVLGTVTYLIGAHGFEMESPYLVSVAVALGAYLAAAVFFRPRGLSTDRAPAA